MPTLSIDDRNFVVHRRHEGHGYGMIVNMLAERGVSVCRRTIQKLCKKFDETGLVTNRPRHRPSKFGSQEHKNFLDECVLNKPSSTARDLANKVFDRFQISVSETTINVMRKSLGWIPVGTQYCQMIREPNKVKRIEWCQRMLDTNETFDNVIFTDECKVQSHQNRHRKCYRKRGQQMPRTPKPKHPYSCLVWAGISKRGSTQIAIFDGIMKSQFYQEQILQGHLLPFIQLAYPDSHRFMQDNDPKHTSRSTQAFMMDNGINWWATPAESPDLNPIENVWNELKNNCEHAHTKAQLIQMIQDFWLTVTPEKCRRYIGHIHTVIPEVIVQNGGPSGY